MRLALAALATAKPPEDWKVSSLQPGKPRYCGAFLCLLRTAIAALHFYCETIAYGRIVYNA